MATLESKQKTNNVIFGRSSAVKEFNCEVVGDNGVGKTSLLLAYQLKRFPTPNELKNVKGRCPSFDSVTVEGASWTVELHDTWNYPECERLRPFTYQQMDVFLFCFSVVVPSSANSLKSQWIPEVTNFCRRTPYILVGTQTDLRDDEITVEKMAHNNLNPITIEEGEKLAIELKAVKYIECSVLTQTGLQELMEEAVKVAQAPRNIKKSKKRKHKCLIL